MSGTGLRPTPAGSPFAVTRDHAHVYSVFGRWCYLCGHSKHWWTFWEKWAEEEHDEPF